MLRIFFFAIFLFGALAPGAAAQVENFRPVTREMLLNPPPGDWLMFSRTYDAQRFSPLDQINRENVQDLRMAWVRALGPGVHENTPLVHDGVLYLVNPGVAVDTTGIQALDATNGNLIWEYQRRLPADLKNYVGNVARAKTLAIFEDLVFYATPDGFMVGLDARTGDLRWETELHDYTSTTQQTPGPIVIEGKVLSGRGCTGGGRVYCNIIALDAQTGELAYTFYTTAAPGEPGGDTWGGLAEDLRQASAWGAPGSYDPVRRLIYWGIGNPAPHTRMKRHGGDFDAIPRVAPSELYSNSTVAFDPDTGELEWYYQYLPGDDWDSDHVQERILLRTAVDPDPSAVKWINPSIPRGEERDIVVTVGEPGGIFALDRENGQFLWATPFPFDVPEFHVSHIDVETGRTHINWDSVVKFEGDRHLMCFQDTKSYWLMAYHPGQNSLYVPYHDQCSDMTAVQNNFNGNRRIAVLRPGSNPDEYSGIAKVNVSTGRLERFYTARYPGNGSVLATAGDLIFWGDMNRRLHAFDAESGEILWQTILGGIIQMSTITYSVDGKQYLAVMTGDGGPGGLGPARVANFNPVRGHNAVYVFALP